MPMVIRQVEVKNEVGSTTMREEIKGRRWERLVDRFSEHPDKSPVTRFGNNYPAIEELGRRLLEFRGRGERIIINEIGVGMGEVGSPLFSRKNVSYEPFEILNQVRRAGVKPGEFTLYVMDIRKDVLLAVKTTKVLRVHNLYLEGKWEYFRGFFPELHELMEEGLIPVGIPEEYRKRIICPKPLDIEKQPAPVKAHITFSFIPSNSLGQSYFENLVESTKEGGYVLCLRGFDESALARLNVEKIEERGYYGPVYRVK